MANGDGSRRVWIVGGLVVFLLLMAALVLRDRDAVLELPGGAEQGVVRRSERFRRLGSPETILGRAERWTGERHKKKTKEEREKDKRQKRR